MRTKLLALALAALLAVGTGGIAAAEYVHAPTGEAPSEDYKENVSAEEVEVITVENVEQNSSTIMFESTEDENTSNCTTHKVNISEIDDDEVEKVEVIPANITSGENYRQRPRH